jgi:hypothetical protein
MLEARAWEPIRHGRHAHQIVEVTGRLTAGVGVGLIVAAPIVGATADLPCDREACELHTTLDLGIAGIVVTAAGLVTTSVGVALPCPAVRKDWALVATPSGIVLVARF